MWPCYRKKVLERHDNEGTRKEEEDECGDETIVASTRGDYVIYCCSKLPPPPLLNS